MNDKLLRYKFKGFLIIKFIMKLIYIYIEFNPK